MARYHVAVTVNTKGREHEVSVETDSVDAVVQQLVKLHPSCTSMVICLVPAKEGFLVTFDQEPSSGFSVECPFCHWGFDPTVLQEHIREKHGDEET